MLHHVGALCPVISDFSGAAIIASFVLSFFEFDMVSTPRFTGFSHYFRMLFDDEVFLTTAKNTLIFAVITRTGRFFAFLCAGLVFK